jgi:23S rRNA (adenine2503-C2)-methyltransferase
MQIEKKTYEQYPKIYYGNFVTRRQSFSRESGMVVDKGAHSFEDMTNISKETYDVRKQLVINHIKVDTIQRSDDGTIKNAVRLHDGLVVESVLIPTNTRTSLRFQSSGL